MENKIVLKERGILKKLTALIMGAVMMLSATSCSVIGGDEEDTNNESRVIGEDGVTTAYIDPDRTIKTAVYEFDTFNPLVTQSQSVRDAMRFVYEPLFELNETLVPEGVLAESWSVSEDGKTVTVQLKQGVLWHDGTEFTASDVEYTVRTIKNSGGVYASCLENVSGYRASGSYTMTFSLSNPTPNFVAMLDFPIVKRNTSMREDSDYVPVGTGPYQYSGKTNYNTIYFANQPNWHKGWVNIAGVSVVMTDTREQAKSLFEAGEIDVATDNIINLDEYAPKGGSGVVEYVTNRLTYIGINFNNKLLWGANTRKALNAVLNKSEIGTGVIFKRGVEIDVPINPSSYYYYDVTENFGARSQTAEEYLRNDGWTRDEDGKYSKIIDGRESSLSLRLLVNSDNQEKVTVAEQIADYYNKFGIEITLDKCSYSEYQSKITSKNFDLFLGETEIPNTMDPSKLVRSGQNYFTYENAELDEVINNMGKTTDSEVLKTLFIQYGDIVTNDMPFIPLYYRKSGIAYRNRIISGLSPNISNPYRNVQQWQLR